MKSIPRVEPGLRQAATFAQEELEAFLAPLLAIFPDRRLQRVAVALVRGLVTARRPHITQAMKSVSGGKRAWSQAKRGYRLVHTERVTTWQWAKSLYRRAQRTVAEQVGEGKELVVAVDPVQFEKPYARRLEGVSQVYKSRPPDLCGKGRLTWGYPAITATVVNLPQPATTYAHWFSYETSDFLSENREIYRALRMTRALFPHHPLRFVMDGGGDDQKVMRWAQGLDATFIIRVAHPERKVEVWNERLRRWEGSTIEELMGIVLWQGTFKVHFFRAGRRERRHIRLGWYRLRLPGDSLVLWLVVIETLDAQEEEERLIGLLTNVEVSTLAAAQTVYTHWRLRGRIEHLYRFDQEEGLDVERMLVRTLPHMQRLFILVLWAMHFVTYALESWPQEIVRWFQCLGGKLHRTCDRSGLYWFLWGLAITWTSIVALHFAATHPFPTLPSTYG